MVVRKNSLITFCICFCLVHVIQSTNEGQPKTDGDETQRKPNIVIIVADDLVINKLRKLLFISNI